MSLLAPSLRGSKISCLLQAIQEGGFYLPAYLYILSLVYKYHICALQSRKVYFYLTNQESTFGLYSLRKYIFTLQSRKVNLCFTVQESTFVFYVFYSLRKYICILQSRKVHLYFTVMESKFVSYSPRKYIFAICTAVGLAFSCQTSDIFPFPLFLLPGFNAKINTLHSKNQVLPARNVCYYPPILSSEMIDTRNALF